MKLKDYRTKKGLSLRDVEKLTGISNSHISLLERGFRKPSLDVINKLAKAYNIKPSSIVRCFKVK